MEPTTALLRETFRQKSVYKMNLVNKNNEDSLEKMTQHLFDTGVVTISDWGALRNDVALTTLDWSEAGATITEDKFAEMYRDEITGDVDWDAVRDQTHKRMNKETKVKAGNAAHCIRRFLFEANIGDILLLNTSEGTVITIITGPPHILEKDAPHRDIDSNHVFGREVSFQRDEDGEVVSFDSKNLPKPMTPDRLTITTLKRDGKAQLLAESNALQALASFKTESEPAGAD
ncbi:hypothetical protein DJ71_26090 [Halorubrum sp. E3]|nr:hypothetical protein DJ71_26090 [Halorubrum sp. E3]OYR80239.1 hypothetical protein DJ72_12755 [Halorubrum distributum]